MKTLYFECNMGAAGDMIMAALLELHPAPHEFIDRLNSIGIPGVSVSMKPSVKCGICGTHVSVAVGKIEEDSDDVHEHGHHNDHDHHHAHSHDHHEHNHSHEHTGDQGHSHEYAQENNHIHAHSGMDSIGHLIGHLDVSDGVKRDALAIYNLIAQAESHAHGVAVSQIHFHEVGTMDAVADIVGVCMLIEELAPQQIAASPVHVGCGQVRCAHGILPVPAPATAHILRDVPIYGGAVRGELCTPTGAAILKHFVTHFGSMPVMRIDKTGYGMGKKDFEAANCVRAMLGDTQSAGDEVCELSCNLDDMTAEAIAFAQQILIEQGALDVYTVSIGMKKGRPGTMLTCLCRPAQADDMAVLMFRHTSTLGIRHNASRRYTLERSTEEILTKYGPVRVKTATGYGVTKAKPEYDDVAGIARAHGISLADVKKSIKLE